MKSLWIHFQKYLENKENTPPPEGLCPNCWGRQEYGGAFYEAVREEAVDTLNLESKKGWIQAYAEKHLGGIELHPKQTEWVCTNCNSTFPKEA